jgi:hypothetical protein
MSKKDVAMATKRKVNAMIYFATMKEVVGNAIGLDERKAIAMETILKNKLMQERVTKRVEKNKWKKK